MPGSELLACGVCSERATDLHNNPVIFDTDPFTRGITTIHLTEHGEYTDDDIACKIDSFSCKAIELRFGGIGIKVLP